MYDAITVEKKWLDYWKGSGIFNFDDKDSEREVFIIDTPPPFTNGDLHMGQVFWVSYIDSIARYMRMKGLNVLYPQGWDVHGFPTELAVEKKYGRNLSREEFYKRAIEVSNANIATMKEQMLKLGASFDERHEYLTMSSEYLAKVQLALVTMHEKGMVYRADHPVPWCTHDGTSISREQAEEIERETSLNHVEFKVRGSKKELVIATTRPELMHACVAVAVNPADERYKDIVGKKVEVPIFGTEVSVIADESVDKDFGTGAEMVCTFGDKEDIKMFYRNKLRMVEAMDWKGKLLNAGKFTGMGVKEARAAMIEALSASGALKKQEKIRQTVKVHDRCKTEAELLSYTQWFIRIKDNAESLKAIGSEINWVPDYSKQRYLDWVNNIEWDWNISRRRIFGTPIPFWYCDVCGTVVAADKGKLPVNPATDNPPVPVCPKCSGKLVGEKDTCDGWVDTCITPLVVAGWPENKSLIERGFPAALRIQGTDIIRTWAFYTTVGTMALTGGKPWESIIAHGMVLGEDGREMHKSWGNGVNPSDVMAKYSSDAIRMWVALSGGIGKDKPFSYKELDHAKGFIVKLYNSANFVVGAMKDAKTPKQEPHDSMGVFDLWILSRFNQVVGEVRGAYDAFTLYEAMNTAINFYWHEFADYYIENVKHRVYSQDAASAGSKAAALFTLKYVLLNSLRLFAPVVPFVCEEVNSMFSKKSIFTERLPQYAEITSSSDYAINGLVFKSSVVGMDYASAGAMLNNVIAEVRKQKAQNRIALNKEITSININVPEEYNNAVQAAKEEIKQICKAQKVAVSSQKEFSVSIKI